MTKKTISTTVAHSDATDFKAWVQDLSGLLDDVGFTKSADTGQIDISGISSRPSAGTVAGYEIRYLDDSLHGEAPIYAKLEFGSAGASTPYFRASVGTGTDGAGNLTGVFFPPKATTSGSASALAGPHDSYACMVDGCVWFSFGVGALGYSYGGGLAHLVIARKVAPDGSPTADAAAAYTSAAAWDCFGPATASFRSVWKMNTPYASSGARGFGGTIAGIGGKPWTFLPMDVSNTITEGGDLQVVPHILAFPEFSVVQQIVSLPPGLLPNLTQFEAAVVGADKRNYIVVPGFREASKELFACIWE